MKKNRINIRYLAILLALLYGSMSGIVFVSCNDDDDEMTSEVALMSYGPMPIARGAELRFIGENLMKVNSIVLPEGIDIPASEFTEHTETGIKLIVPQNAEPGLVVLKTDDGDITTKTQITYSEPISIDNLSPGTIKPGQEITITGEYLNLIKEVIFTERVSVGDSSFTAQSRKEIKLIVPEEAQTGTIAVSNGAEDPIVVYSETELAVVTPTLTAVSPSPVKAGTTLTITGTDLDLVKRIDLGGGKIINEFASQSETSITLTVPADTKDGKVTVYPASMVAIESSEDVVMVVPTVNVSPTTIKNGGEITVTGTDLDLVTAVTFAGGAGGTITDLTETEMKVLVPDAAVSGDLVFSTAADKSVSGGEITIIKPTITEITPNPVSAGNEITITGTDLDLVVSVTFAGDVTVDVSPESETSITLEVPVDAESGDLTLTMVNGETVVSSLIVDKPLFCYIPILPGENDTIKAGELLSVELANEDKLTDIMVNGASVQYILNGTTCYILIPENSSGATDLTLMSSNGEITYELDVLGGGIVETIVYEGPKAIGWGDPAIVPITAFQDVPVGSILKIYFSQTENWGQAQLNNGNWAVIPFDELGGDGYITTNTYNDKSVTEQELVLTQDVLDNILNNSPWGDGLIIQGQDWIIAKVSIITTTASETVIFEGPKAINWGDAAIAPISAFDGVNPGAILKIYFEQTENWGQAQINNGNWAVIPFDELGGDGYITTNTYDDKSVTEQELVLTSAVLDNIRNNAPWDDGLIIQGQDWIITKITIIN
ncbi:IPT/TIG domain-containing protein [Maribellus mangrovi]|uniref:IPT/TIG domain-containing protein n=1 Tax=Maribellus mangrovi TaxID=3133146 RepID=UPI0030EF5D7F